MSAAAIKFLTDEVASLRLRLKALENSMKPVEKEKKEEKMKPGRPKKVEKKEEETDIPQEEKVKEKRKPSPWALKCEVMIPVIMRLKREHSFKINHMMVCGYLREKNIENPSETEVLEALQYLTDHPEYMSAHQKKKILKSVDASSVSSGEGKKARGRPKKIKSSVSSSEDKKIKDE